MTRREPTRKKTTLALLIIVPLFLSAFAGNCKKKPDNNSTADSSNTSNTPGPEETAAADKALGLAIREQFTKSHKVSGVNITVIPQQLVVFLSGEAASQAEFDEAVRISKDVEVEVRGRKFKAKDVNTSGLTIKHASP
jgi:hypothetical protein